MNEPNQFLNLSQRLNLRSSNQYIALQNLSIYSTWKNTRKQYKNNKLKIIAPDGSCSVSDIQDYIQYIVKNMKQQKFLLFMFTSIELTID